MPLFTFLTGHGPQQSMLRTSLEVTQLSQIPDQAPYRRHGAATKCLLQKYRDLSLVPNTLMKAEGGGMHSSSSTGEQRQGAPWGLLASQTS